MRCLTCKYYLSHLTEHRCPECGREFDPNRAETYSAGVTFMPWRTWWWIMFACYLLNLAFISYAMADDLSLTLDSVTPGVCITIALTAGTCLLVTFPMGLVLYTAVWVVRNVFLS